MVAQDVLDLDGSGIGCLEHSHRGEVFDQVLSQTESLTRSVLGVPSEYSVLFLQGGATQQFGMIPMNSAWSDTARKSRGVSIRTRARWAGWMTGSPFAKR